MNPEDPKCPLDDAEIVQIIRDIPRFESGDEYLPIAEKIAKEIEQARRKGMN